LFYHAPNRESWIAIPRANSSSRNRVTAGDISPSPGTTTAYSKRSDDGFRFTADSEPFLTPERTGPFAAYEEFGVEDPRVTRLENE
jgi:predicted GH43/DUF377 family glycosyl hydrolase